MKNAEGRMCNFYIDKESEHKQTRASISLHTYKASKITSIEKHYRNMTRKKWKEKIRIIMLSNMEWGRRCGFFFHNMDWIGKWKSEKRKNVLKYDVLLFNFVLLIKPSFHIFCLVFVYAAIAAADIYFMHSWCPFFSVTGIFLFMITSLDECSKIKRRIQRFFCELINRELSG